MAFTVSKDRNEKGFGCVNKDNVIYIGNGSTESTISADTKSTSSVVSSDTPNIGWGQRYTLKELEITTGGFLTENVVGEGGYGIVYKGILQENSVVAVKNLLTRKVERAFASREKDGAPETKLTSNFGENSNNVKGTNSSVKGFNFRNECIIS
ncbi:kinase superfamily protein [Thalictrum thalictroides]|uniref:Kinase superfamily protein n=1 Tax=Thalictrum thalictroides TaxID=46969 RepID=A0A7J6VN37_THATH|nr:kinase superfamily protein [Thalictrum thalictroides]